MFDQVPVWAWLLIALAAFAWLPAHYVYRHIVHSPSRRDITQPAADLSWRTTGQFFRSLGILVALVAAAIFIFTPAAEQFAKSPRFLPVLMMCFGAWTLFTVLQGLSVGRIEPFVKGFDLAYERAAQPKRFWASLTWNAFLGCLFLWLAYQTNEQATADRCYNEGSAHSPEESLSACNKLIAEADSLRDDIGDLIAARGVAFHQSGDHRRALADYSEALRLDPRDFYSHYNRALIYQKLGDIDRAVADYSAATRLRPEDADAYLRRGLIF